MTAGQMLMLSIVAFVAMRVTGQIKGGRFSWWLAALLALQVAAFVVYFKRGSWFCAVVLIGTVLATRASWKLSVAFLAAVRLLLFTGLLLNGFVEHNFGDTELMMVYAVVMGVMGMLGGTVERRVPGAAQAAP